MEPHDFVRREREYELVLRHNPLEFVLLHFKKRIVLKEILNLGADVNSKDRHSYTPLCNVLRYHGNSYLESLAHPALWQHLADELDVTKLQMLLQCVADEKDSILHFAARYCYSDNLLDEVRLLIRYGADVNVPDSEKFTPLHMAVFIGNKVAQKLDIIKELWQGGADFTLENVARQTPLLCILRKREGIISLSDLECAKFIIKFTVMQKSKRAILGYCVEPVLKTDLLISNRDLIKNGIKKRGEKGLLRYYEDCLSEISQMRTDIIVHKKSIFDLASEADSVTGRNLKTEEIKRVINKMFKQFINNTYPIYGVGFISSILSQISFTSGNLKRGESESMIMQIFQKFTDFDYHLMGVDFISNILSRTDLYNIIRKLQMCSVNVESGKENVALNYYCIMNVAEFLPDKDLINLIIASCEKKECRNAGASSDIFPVKINKNLKRSSSGRCKKRARLESPLSIAESKEFT